MKFNTVIIQPPLVQLNTPYPSGAYLLSFFKKMYKIRGIQELSSGKNLQDDEALPHSSKTSSTIQGKIEWLDLSTELFHRIFCRAGIKFIFEKSRQKAMQLADSFERKGDENSAFQLRRYLCQSEAWIEWIDTIVQIVCQNSRISGREFTHEFVRSPHVPRGNRVETYLSSLAEQGRDVYADDAQILASLSLADLADFITVAYDPEFSLIRYAERLASSCSSFDDILKNLDGPVLKDFLKPLLIEKLTDSPEETLFCITVPFPGCFQAALYCARLIRKFYGSKAFICIGGGYVNTELRNVQEKRLFDFCDILSYDKGYGSYQALFDLFEKNDFSCQKTRQILLSHDSRKNPIYKIRHLCFECEEKNAAPANNKNPETIPPSFAPNSISNSENLVIVPQKESDEKLEIFEREMLKTIIPDFSGIDFTKSPRLADDNNAMHRIWNDGAWLKAFMAYGCYWHRCAFCDTTLDYVKDYCGTNVPYLYDGLYQQAEKTGIYGIHFVDEACPPVYLQKFALKNLAKSKQKQRLTFWGNIRFEKTFSRDLADLLSKGGLTAVSGGVEIATGKGLDAVNKGTEIQNIVNAICAFKEAGILVHTYMIFGFWNQSEQDLIDSMETLRQMFEAGLIDSAFWHKFSLTRHSTVFKEWQEGKHPDLKPIFKKNTFAENDVNFEGEEKSEKYAVPLNAALNFWMNGEKLGKNVESYFPFRVPRPSIPKNYIEKLIENYERKRDAEFTEIPEKPAAKKYVWLGGKPVLQKNVPQNNRQHFNGKQISYTLSWSYMGEVFEVHFAGEKEAQDVLSLLEEIRAENFEKPENTGEHILSILKKKTFSELRGKGLCQLL